MLRTHLKEEKKRSPQRMGKKELRKRQILHCRNKKEFRDMFVSLGKQHQGDYEFFGIGLQEEDEKCSIKVSFG
jgi:hypothetical protein